MNDKDKKDTFLAKRIWQDVFIIAALLLSISTIVVTYFKDIEDHDLVIKIIVALLAFALLIPSAKLLGKVLDTIKRSRQQ